MNPLVAALLILLTAKLTVLQDMSWWIVLSPFWVPLIVAFLSGMWDEMNK